MATTTLTRTKPETARRILDAAFACVTDVGLSRTTVEYVAKQAGLARQTIYRYFPSKDHLIMALVLREEEKFLAGTSSAFEEAATLAEALERGTLFCLRFARDHPLLDRLLATDPETLLPFLTTRGSPVLSRARQAFAQLVPSKAWVRADMLDQAADTVARVIVSYALSPPDRPPEIVARDLARILVTALTGKEAQRR